MNTLLAEYLDPEIGSAVQYLRVLLEVGRRIDEALQFDNAAYPVKAAELELRSSQNVEPHQASEFVALLGREFSTQPAIRRPTVGR